MTESIDINPELDIIKDFLLECIPFDQLSETQLKAVTKAIEITYHRSGHVFTPDTDEGGLRIIRSGAAELRGKNGQLIDRFGDTVSFNLLALNKEQAGIHVTLIEDALIYHLPEKTYQDLRSEHRDFDRFFNSQRNRRIRRAARHSPLPQEMMSVVGDIMSEQIVSVAPEQPIQVAAQLMSEKRISSILVMDEHKLVGILTDRDIRSRCVAAGLNFDTPVFEIMTRSPQTISADKTIFDATLFMTKRNIHHLPITKNDEVIGVVTTSDLILSRRDDPVYLVQHVKRQKEVNGLKATVSKLPDLMIQWTNAGIRAEQVASIFTAVSDAVTERLIDLFIERNRHAPADFAWLGFGSQGRAEQLLGGDQDNALLISDVVTEKDATWFEKLSHWVCDGLNECGYIYCPGDVMATNTEWRQTLNGWQNTVSKWARSPTPAAVMRVSIFFDLRVVYGSESLGKDLHKHMLNTTSSNKIFLSALAENVLEHKPPLGIFRQFVVEHDGQHEDELDLKKCGIIPIVEIARIHSLAAKAETVNTHDRLKELAEKKILTINESRNLQDALRVIMQIRLKEQVKELTSAQKPNNHINPKNLSKLVRKQLRDAFAVIRDAQQGVNTRYRPGL
jgi:CBS domain-containing protein